MEVGHVEVEGSRSWKGRALGGGVRVRWGVAECKVASFGGNWRKQMFLAFVFSFCFFGDGSIVSDLRRQTQEVEK